MALLKTKIAAVMCGMTMAGAGVLSAGTHSGFISLGAHSVAAATQATPTTSGSCLAESGNVHGETEDSDNGSASNTDANDDTDGNVKGGDSENDSNANDSETEAAAAAGQLSEGQDLLPQAGITLDQAVAAATANTQGTLGDVELKTVDGALVFEVQIGDQDVHVDAADGTIVTTDSGDIDAEDSECNDDAAATPGALASGSEMQSQATVTLAQAVATAQGAATGQLGSVDLELNDSGVLVYSVQIGTQEVSVDAQTGKVLEVVDAKS